jgi:hypothetical protein
MGGAVSVPADCPDPVTKDKAQEICGDKWDEKKWEAEGKGAVEVAKSVFEKGLQKKRRLSLIGTENEGKDLAEITQKDSEVAVKKNEEITAAADADKPKILVDSMKEQWAAKADMDVEYASWALSCIATLCQKGEDVRKTLLDLGAPGIMMDYMESEAAPALTSDIFTQWQGTQAMGNFCCDTATAEAFGERGLHAVVDAINNTDVSELSFTAMRAIKQLLSNSEKLKEAAKAEKADEAIVGLMELFPDYMQLKFMGTELVKQINPDNASVAAAAAAPIQKRGRRLSLVGTADEGKGLADIKRRNSVIAMEKDTEIKAAADADKPKVLIDSMKEQWAAKADMEEEYASWALSCLAELCQKGEETRKVLLDLGAVGLMLDYMECSEAPALTNDIFTQWQGTQAIGNFCCDTATADAFGERGLHAVVDAITNTDVSELSFTAMRALKQLLSNSEKLMDVAKNDKADEAITELMGMFPDYMQLKFMGTELVKQINPGAATA